MFRWRLCEAKRVSIPRIVSSTSFREQVWNSGMIFAIISTLGTSRQYQMGPVEPNTDEVLLGTRATPIVLSSMREF
jgi:hypothetical protein